MNPADQTQTVTEVLPRPLRISRPRTAVASVCYRILLTLIACLLLLSFCFANPDSTTYARKQKRARSATIKILTRPAGLPIEIDGKSFGETLLEYRELDVVPGLHTVVITLPGGARWIREIELQPESFKCVVLEFNSLSAVPGTDEVGDVRGTICDCAGVFVSNVPWWKRAAAKLKGKKK